MNLFASLRYARCRDARWPRRCDVPDLDIHPEQGRHPRRVMAAFAQRFEKESGEVDVLWLLGLFDRPATKVAH